MNTARAELQSWRRNHTIIIYDDEAMKRLFNKKKIKYVYNISKIVCRRILMYMQDGGKKKSTKCKMQKRIQLDWLFRWTRFAQTIFSIKNHWYLRTKPFRRILFVNVFSLIDVWNFAWLIKTIFNFNYSFNKYKDSFNRIIIYVFRTL